jgi:hypothetical protein
MKKKGLLVLALVVIIAGGSFAEDNAASLDLFPLFKGIIAADNDDKTGYFDLALGYERLVAPHFSVGGDLDLYFGKTSDLDTFYFGLGLKGRWYPLSEQAEKLFIGTGLGFNSLSIDGSTKGKKGGFVGLTAELKAGWRLMFSQFFVEPSMAYVYSKFGLAEVTPLGWQAGLRIGLVF